MKKLILLGFLLFLLSPIYSQKGSVRFGAYSGLTLVDNNSANSAMDEWLMAEYSSIAYINFIISIPIAVAPKARRSTNNSFPFGLDFYVNTTRYLGLGLEYNNSKVETRADLVDYPVSLIYSHERITFMPKLIFHFNPKAVKSIGLDFYTQIGAGINKSKMVCTTIVNNIIADVTEEKGKPYAFKVSAGLAYFPISNLGLNFEIGTSSTNFRIGLVYRTKS